MTKEEKIKTSEKAEKVHETKDAEQTDEEVSEELLEEEMEKDVEEVQKEESASEEIKEKEKVQETPRDSRDRRGRRTFEQEEVIWTPKTKLGIQVKKGEVKNIDEILDAKKKILEPEIVDTLIDVKSDLLAIGQSKGKFGGGKRRAWRQTQRKTKEGNVASFSTLAVVGDENGHVGVGNGKAKETLPARDKAVRKAKINLVKVKRGCASFDCSCSELHTVPFKVEGKSGSVRVRLIPAPQGTGLVVAKELRKVLHLAGIKDVYSKTFGKNRTTFNSVKACIDALKKTNTGEMK